MFTTDVTLSAHLVNPGLHVSSKQVNVSLRHLHRQTYTGIYLVYIYTSVKYISQEGHKTNRTLYFSKFQFQCTAQFIKYTNNQGKKPQYNKTNKNPNPETPDDKITVHLLQYYFSPCSPPHRILYAVHHDKVYFIYQLLCTYQSLTTHLLSGIKSKQISSPSINMNTLPINVLCK